MDASQATFMRDGLLAKLEGEHKRTMAILEHVPEDKLDYRPDERLRPFGELAYHIYTVGTWFTGMAASGEVVPVSEGEPTPAPKTKPELLDACRKLNQQITKMAAAAPGEKLAKDVTLPIFGTFPAVTYLDVHISHLIHHRAQLGMYMRLMGAKVPAVYGDSLDYPLDM